MAGPLWDLLSLPAAFDPDREILSYRGRRWTFSSLIERVARLEPAIGVGPVSIMEVNTDLAVALLYACFKAGREVRLYNYRLGPDEVADLVPRNPSGSFFFGIRYADIAHRVVRRGLENNVRLLDTDGFGVLPVDREAGPWAARSETTESRGRSSDVVLFTSGTTAQPKPIGLDGPGLLAYVASTTPLPTPETADQATLLSVPLFHVAGLVGLLRSVFMGRRVVLQPQFQEEEWLRTVESEGVTHAFLVPTMLRRILDAPGLVPSGVASLEVITYGGAPMPLQLIGEALQRFPETVGFTSTYGLTESGGTVCVLTPEDHEAARHDEAGLQRLSSVGRAVSDLSVFIVDDDGKVLESGEVGEVVVVGSRIRPAPTPIPGAGKRWLRTGDIGYLDRQGYLYLCGRADDMIIRGGENISPTEIETVLLSYPGIKAAAVLGVPDEIWGERVAAFLVAPGLDADEVVAHCKSRLASYKVPEVVHFSDSFPMTTTGKVLKRELRQRIASA